jgi:glucose/arabinose dehydrogenase
MEPFENPDLVDLQAHSAPQGLAFYYSDSFPVEYYGNMFVAYHGSWNRKERTGYKIVSINMTDLSVKYFATGWLQGSNVLGRPVDIIVADDGSLFVSDDNAGNIYGISYKTS